MEGAVNVGLRPIGVWCGSSHSAVCIFKFLDSLVEAILDCEFDKGKT
jgi:hypothetical protein